MTEIETGQNSEYNRKISDETKDLSVKQSACIAPDASKRNRVKLFLSLLSLGLSMFVTALDVLIVGTIIDTVCTSFGDYTKSGWIVTGYSLPNALFSLLWGRLSAVLGPRISVISCIILFETGSLISALAKSMNMLISGRVIAGVGGSGLQTLSLVIGCQLVNEKSRPLVLSLLNCTFAVASIVGPFLGGAFTTHVTWRWCFYINLPIGGLAIAIFIFFYNPEGADLLEKGSQTFKKLLSYRRANLSLKQLLDQLLFGFDIVSFVLFTAGWLLFLLALTFGGQTHPWKSGIVISFIIVGVLLIALSLIYDFRLFDHIKTMDTFRPLLSWHLMSQRAILNANFTGFFSTIAYNVQMIYSVQFFQLVYGFSAWKAGLHLIPILVSTVVFSIASGVIIKKTGHIKPLLVFGSAMGVLGSGLMILLNNTSTKHTQIGVLILPGVALGFVLPAALITCHVQLDRTSPSYGADMLETTSVNALLKSLGTTVGSILSTMVFSTSLHNKMKNSNILFEVSGELDSIASYRLDHFDGPRSEMGCMLNDSIRNTFWMALGSSVVAFLCSLLVSRRKVSM
ncbi:MDR family MFS transporter [Lachancea thermotolerans CBS 6340]|uniref:KLTH0B00132p n=1 Tax=Lachancea thermotolerans (strain ATCC 56472 / CBS 6340 / NRRL Y-8284) TaxID=559295 RepID=C5DC56_LACTC|nr:KLTH0B00132p [Lachancea thermotolerans CBS 6340]CAR21366.1 KLTH0B00132p [Lachancea thermotolerans CBS 6340]